MAVGAPAPGYVGGYVWVDLNGNGLLDDPTLTGAAAVELVDADGVVVASGSALGRYALSAPPGTYRLHVVPADGSAFTVTGGDSGVDADGYSAFFDLAAGGWVTVHAGLAA